MTQFTWKIRTLERQASNGFVTSAHYYVRAEDAGFVADKAGIVEYANNSEESFVPFEQLTEAQVIGWVQGAVDQQAIEAALQAEIDAQQNPTQLTGMPWGNEGVPA